MSEEISKMLNIDFGVETSAVKNKSSMSDQSVLYYLNSVIEFFITFCK